MVAGTNRAFCDFGEKVVFVFVFVFLFFNFLNLFIIFFNFFKNLIHLFFFLNLSVSNKILQIEVFPKFEHYSDLNQLNHCYNFAVS